MRLANHDAGFEIFVLGYFSSGTASWTKPPGIGDGAYLLNYNGHHTVPFES